MLVVMRDHASQKTIEHVVDLLHEAGAEAHLSQGEVKTIIGVIGEREIVYSLELEGLPGVEEVIRVLKPYKLVSRDFQPDDTVVRVGGTAVGGGAFAVIAGPCSIESEEQMMTRRAGCHGCGRDDAARRRVQAAHEPVRVPGHGSRGAQAAARGRR